MLPFEFFLAATALVLLAYILLVLALLLATILILAFSCHFAIFLLLSSQMTQLQLLDETSATIWRAALILWFWGGSQRLTFHPFWNNAGVIEEQTRLSVIAEPCGGKRSVQGGRPGVWAELRKPG